MAVTTVSTLNDLMFSFYQQAVERDLGNKLYGPVQLASALSTNGTISAETTFPYPEKTVYSSVYYLEQGAITAGTISLETAFVAGYTGTWAVVEARGFTGGTGSRTTLASFSTGPYMVMRARVTAALVGGTVDIWFAST